MSDFAVSDMMTASDRRQKKDSRITIVKIIVLILCILLVIEGIFYTLIIPCLAPVKVQFSGLKTIPSSVLLEKLSQTGDVTWIQFDAGKAVDSLSAISAVDTVAVDKVFPDKVIINVKERIPVAKTVVSINGRSIPVQIDENGVLFISTASVSGDSSIPLVSGLPIESMQTGMRIPSKYKPLMAQIASVQNLEQKYFAAVSEIKVVPKEYGNYELVLYPVHKHVKVLTDRSLNEDALKYMMVALDVVNSLESDVQEIDLRYGSISYRSR